MSDHPHTPNGPTPEPELDLERHLDGAMPADEAALFERRLATEPALRAQAAAQAEIDAALRRAAGPPEACADRVDAMLEALPNDTANNNPPAVAGTLAPPATGRPMWLKVAAVVALLVLGGVAAYIFTRPDPADSIVSRDPVRVAVVAMYRAQQSYGFHPDWVCDQARFKQTCIDRMGVGLALAETPDDRAMLGMTSIRRGNGHALIMLGQAMGEDVIVYIDRADQLTHYDLEANDGLHIHRAQLGDLRLIEVSPLDAPAFLDYLDVPVDADTDADTSTQGGARP